MAFMSDLIELHVRDLSVRIGGKSILSAVNLSLSQGGCLVILGGTGSGKTTLLKAIAGQLHHTGSVSWGPDPSFHPRIALINRQHQFTNLSNVNSFYYQQRFNSFDAEDAKTVRDELAEYARESEVVQVLKDVGISHCADRPMIQLSNGEHKRFQLAKALLQRSEVILLDNPYTGLDTKARAMLSHLLDSLVARNILVILVSGHDEFPSSTTQVALLEEGTISRYQSPEEYRSADRNQTTPSYNLDLLRSMPSAYHYPPFEYAVRMKNVNIRYGDKQVLEQINWEVKNGDCWNLSGYNGSGKSTLLSLINGDNPQAFANEIYLFDRKKGSGESIWDIKRKIGYVSPELHHYFDASSTAFDTVASGLFDTVGLFRQLSTAQAEITAKWMEFFGVSKLTSRRFHTLSDGEQRQVLLTRALVKNPPLLLLDEPCQGLDDLATNRFISVVDEICRQLHKTLIFVSHYSADLPACVEKTLALENGRMRTL
jgi:molybdate transport system ATP-binding protein